MARQETNPQDELLPAEASNPQKKSASAAATLKGLSRRVPKSPRLRLALAFAGGLLLGWILLGWILFPVRWTDTDPWDMHRAAQQRYVQMLAQVYWDTQDLQYVNASVDGWDRQELNDLLGSMMSSPDQTPESRQYLVALRDALTLPAQPTSLMASLLQNSKAIVVTGLLAMLPVFLGVALVVTPLLRRAGTAAREREELSEEGYAAGQRGGAPGDGIFTDEYEDEEEESEEEKEEEEKKPSLLGSETSGADEEIGDLLSAFLDEDEQGLEQLQALAKGLQDITIDQLHDLAAGLARDLARVNTMPRKQRVTEE